MEDKKKITIDRATWRCGYKSLVPTNKNGIGETVLCNDQGFKCCLGFACQQLTGVSDETLLYKPSPEHLRMEIPGFTSLQGAARPLDTQLSDDAIDINDSERTTREQKEIALTERFAQDGFTLEFTGEYPKEE